MNINAGISTAMTGMNAGSQFGPKGSIIGAGVGLLAGLSSTDKSKAALKAQQQYNDAVVKNTITDLFDRERAQQVERMRTARALQSYQAQGKTQISTVRAGYGAADLIGASAQALAQAIDYQTTQALEATRFNYAVGFDNYLTSLEQTTNKGVNTLQQNIDIGQQQPVDISSMFKAGKQLYGDFKQMGGSNTGFSAGLQFGSGTPQGASNNPMPSQYSLPSNLNLQFTGNMNQTFNPF